MLYCVQQELFFAVYEVKSGLINVVKCSWYIPKAISFVLGTNHCKRGQIYVGIKKSFFSPTRFILSDISV